MIRLITIGMLLIAFSSQCFATDYYKEDVKFGKDDTFVDMSADFGDDYNANVYLSNVYVGLKKKAKVLFVTPDAYENDNKKFNVSDIEGNAKGIDCGTNLIGMFQFVDIYPGTGCTAKLEFELTKELITRIDFGFVKPAKFVAIGGEVKNRGSVITTHFAGGSPDDVSYFDESDAGWTVSYDSDTNIVTVEGGIDEAYLDNKSGCFDLGVAYIK